MDGLVSTGNKFPNTILEIIFANKKIFSIFFIHILFCAVDNRTIISLLYYITYHHHSCAVIDFSYKKNYDVTTIEVTSTLNEHT